MTSGKARLTWRLTAMGTAIVAGIAACGQRGPLVLPGDAPPPQRTEQSQSPGSQQQDDERENER